MPSDPSASDYEIAVETGHKTVAVVTLSDGQCLRFPLQLPSVGVIVPTDADADGDSDLVFVDSSSGFTQTVWNESGQEFRTGPVHRAACMLAEPPQVVSGSGVDASSLTSPPLADQELTTTRGAVAIATSNRTGLVCWHGKSPSPLRFLIYSLTRRGPPAVSSTL